MTSAPTPGPGEGFRIPIGGVARDFPDRRRLISFLAAFCSSKAFSALRLDGLAAAWARSRSSRS